MKALSFVAIALLFVLPCVAQSNMVVVDPAIQAKCQAKTSGLPLPYVPCVPMSVRQARRILRDSYGLSLGVANPSKANANAGIINLEGNVVDYSEFAVYIPGGGGIALVKQPVIEFHVNDMQVGHAYPIGLWIYFPLYPDTMDGARNSNNCEKWYKDVARRSAPYLKRGLDKPNPFPYLEVNLTYPIQEWWTTDTDGNTRLVFAGSQVSCSAEEDWHAPFVGND